ncbi:MAG: SIMPL domain-containing protein [Alphaproteobacteria bacterium]
MKKTLTITAGIIGAAAVLDLIFGVFEKPKEIRKINVNGECLTSVPKDRTAITLRVTTLDKNAAKSMKMATEKMAAITDYLKTIDVKMQTTEFNSYEKSEWNHVAQKSENLGIETRIAVEVSASNPEIIESVLNKYAGQPDIFTENLRMFTSSEALKPAMEKCLGAAVEDARVRANALVSGNGLKAGKLLSVSYGNVSYEERPYANYRLMGAKMATAESAAFDTSGTIVGKDTEITVNVSATFEIK